MSRRQPPTSRRPRRPPSSSGSSSGSSAVPGPPAETLPQAPPGSPSAPSGAAAGGAARASRRQKAALALLGAALALVLLAGIELVLRLTGTAGETRYDDPFVGFAPGSDLFALDPEAGVYRTRPAKLAFFNEQEFPAVKAPGSYRAFALGGSTTAGRPYDDHVSFARWLERYLEAAAPQRRWEVVNAGAISYASYRVVLLMRELVRYEPDLFVVYTGHNEFLEERSYPEIIHQNPALKRLRMALSRLRLAAVVRGALAGDEDEPAVPTTLAPEAVAKLDGWTALERYRRDGELTTSIRAHFQHNLEQMVRIARDHGAAIVFVTPVANLKDFSPFKSQHADGLAPAAAEQVAAELARGRALLGAPNSAPDSARDADTEPGAEGAAAALAAFQRARQIDPLYAESHFREGQALLALGRGDDALAAFERARDLDVAPLRATGPLLATVREVAREQQVPLIDLEALLAADSRRRRGHQVLGDEYLIDHVHPHIEIHSLLAERLLVRLADDGVVPAAALAGPAVAERRAIDRRVLAGLDREYYARRDLNLSKVLGWAGKLEEAEAPLERAAAVLPDEPEVHFNRGVLYQRTGRPEQALEALDRAAELAPGWAPVPFNRGVVLARLGRVGEARAAFRQALALQPDYPEARHNLERLRGVGEGVASTEGGADGAVGGLDGGGGVDTAATAAGDLVARGVALARQGRLADAAKVLEQAAAERPGDAEAHYNLGLVNARLGRGSEAEAAYRRAAAADPGHSLARNNLGILLAGRGDLAAAERWLREAAAADPESAEAAFNLGVLLDQRGRSAEAQAVMERAVALEPDAGRFHHGLGRLLAARGDDRRALAHLRRAAALGEPVPPELLAELQQGP